MMTNNAWDGKTHWVDCYRKGLHEPQDGDVRSYNAIIRTPVKVFVGETMV